VMPPITRLTTAAGAILVVALLAFFLGEPLGVATWIVAAIGALTLLAATALLDRPGLTPVVRGVGWDVIIFVTGIFIISVGLRNAGLTALLTARISAAGADLLDLTATTALLAAALSAVLNNHPTANLMALAIEELPGASLQVKKLVALSALIGGDLGPKMLPVGSLAALLWLRLLAARGISIPVARYVAIGVPVTLFALLLAVWALNLEIAVVRSVFEMR
jgi:arsenical pump membrane protein